MLPFELIKETVNEKWEPKIGQEYLVEYQFRRDKNSEFLVGRFSKVWFGYSLHWFWSASSLQLSMDNAGSNPDWKRFKNIWKLTRKKDKKIQKKYEFLTKNDVNI